MLGYALSLFVFLFLCFPPVLLSVSLSSLLKVESEWFLLSLNTKTPTRLSCCCRRLVGWLLYLKFHPNIFTSQKHTLGPLACEILQMLCWHKYPTMQCSAAKTSITLQRFHFNVFIVCMGFHNYASQLKGSDGTRAEWQMQYIRTAVNDCSTTR